MNLFQFEMKVSVLLPAFLNAEPVVDYSGYKVSGYKFYSGTRQKLQINFRSLEQNGLIRLYPMT